MIGLIPWWGDFKGTTQGTPAEYQLKLSTLYYEKLIHNWWKGTKDENSRMIDLLSSQYSVDPDDMASVWISIEDVAPELVAVNETKNGPVRTAGNYVFQYDYLSLIDKTGQYRRGYRGIVDRGVADEFGWSLDHVRRMRETDPASYHYKARGVACAAFGTALLWADLRSRVECVLIAFDRAQLLAGRKLLGDRTTTDSSALRSLFELALPSIGVITWKTVFKLRKERAMSDLRKWMDSVLRTESREQLSERVMSEIWQMVAELMPSPAIETATALLSNVPLPIPVNPFGVAASLKAVGKSFQQNKVYRWALMFHRIGQVLRQDSEPK